MKIKENKKSGFTLSETLITLAIIGVVAALTLPTMIANHQKKVYVVQLQKAISTLEQGFKMMMADDAVDNLNYTSVFELTLDSEYGECTSDLYNNDEACTKFFDAWKKYFNISDISAAGDGYVVTYPYDDEDPTLDGSSSYMLKFADGMWLTTFSGYLGAGETSFFEVDVNGAKGPNTFGRDIFRLYLSSSGDGIIYGSISDDGSISPCAGTKEACTSSRYCCVEYLMNNGWVMDY